MITRHCRDRLADVERGQTIARHGVWRGTRYVAVMMQANGSVGAHVLHSVGVADEGRRLVGNAAVFDPNVRSRAGTHLAARHACTVHTHLVGTHAIVRDHARLYGLGADLKRRVTRESIGAFGRRHARDRAFTRHALVTRGALRLVVTLIARRSAIATHAGVPRAPTGAVSIFAARSGVVRDAPHRAHARIPKDATNDVTRAALARAIRRAHLSRRAIVRIAAIDRDGHARTAGTGGARAGRTARTRTAGGRTRAG